MSDTYKANVECGNCGHAGEAEIAKGKRVYDSPCPNCSCESLHLAERQTSSPYAKKDEQAPLPPYGPPRQPWPMVPYPSPYAPTPWAPSPPWTVWCGTIGALGQNTNVAWC